MREDFKKSDAVSFSGSLGIEDARAQKLFDIIMGRFRANFEGQRDETKTDLIEFAISTGESANEIYFMIWIMAGKLAENRAHSTKQNQDAKS